MSKITFLINSLSSGGAEKVLSVLVTELIRQNYKIEIIFLERNEFYSLPKEVKKTYLSNFDGTQSGILKLIYIPFHAYKLSSYIKKNNITIVQSHIFRANYINILAKFFGSGHKAQVVTAGRVSRYLEQGLLGKVNLFLISHLYKRADLIISKAQGMQDDMLRLFNFTNKQMIINNPYDIQKIVTLSTELVDEFDFQENKKYLISVGRLIPLKRNHELIESLSKFDNNLEILFLGDGIEKDNLQRLSVKLNIEKRVHFLGNVKNPYKFISKCDIFVSCSESEGFPNVIVEAMICGIPIVSSDCVSGPREILAPHKNNKFGMLFPVGNSSVMVQSIKLLLENKNIAKKMAKNAKLRANDFALNYILDKYKKVLEID